MAHHILIVDDEENLCWLLKETFTLEGYKADYCHTIKDAESHVFTERPDVVILDIDLPDGNGRDLLEKIMIEASETIVFMLTAQDSVKLAVECLRMGAAHFLTKPFSNNELVIKVEQAIREKLREGQLEALHTKILREGSHGEIVGSSPPMKEVYNLIEQISSIDNASTVLITGETGTGKEKVAKAIHSRSPRRDAPFMAINCTALPDSLLESELFGHEKGAFTGADKQRRGFFELARGGSLFLDEIGELTPNAQAKLLRVLQEKKIMRIGGTKDISVDVRIIAATNRNLETMIENGEFRDDLFFRLNVFPIHVPPLRQRGSDIILLANHFLKRIGQKLKVTNRVFTESAKQALSRAPWPGNVRQLENLIERAILTAPDCEITSSILGLENGESIEKSSTKDDSGTSCLKEIARTRKLSLADLEELYIKLLMKEHDGNKKVVSAILDVDAKTLYRKLKKYGNDTDDG